MLNSNYRSTKPPQSSKHNPPGYFFQKQPCSPAKTQFEHTHIVSENPTPHYRKPNNPHYYNQPRQNSFNMSSGESLELQHRKRQSSNNLANDSKKPKSKDKNHLFNMLIRDMSKRSESLQKRLEETYNLKSTKGSAKAAQNNSFNFQSSNWYAPQKQKLSQTMQKKTSNKVNNSLDGHQTGDVSFENTILQRGYQDYSGILQQSDCNKNDVEPQEYNPKAIKMLEKGKGMLKDKQIVEAIECLKKCVDLDNKLLEAHYFLGIGYLSSSQFSLAVSEFQSVIQQDAIHRKNVYLLSAISYKKLSQIEQAITILTRAIQLFPRYFDAYIYRGKLYLKQSQIDKADSDFSMAISLSPQKGLGYLGKADCLRSVNNYKEAIKCYSKAVSCEQAVGNAALLKKAITLYESQQFEECSKDLNKLLEGDPMNSEAYYFKGLCKLKLNNPSEGLLSFEQSIKHNNSKKAVTKSLYEIAKMKIEQRDFYAAYHTLNRADKLETEKSYLEKFRLFTEAVIFLMKRKFADSLVNFTEIQNNYQVTDFLKPLFYAYRAYGYFCLSNHQKALEDYKQLMDFSQVEPSIHYNRFLCEGIIKANNGQYDKSVDYFQKAGRIFQKKMEPIFYQGVTQVQMAFKQKNDKLQYLLQGLRLIDAANALNDQNANLYYIRSVIKAFLMNMNEALADIDKAIEKSEDNMPKYFYFRGIVYGCLKQYKAATNDFSICTNLDESFSDAYLQKAKCQFLCGETASAFADLQHCIALQPDDPRIHVWAGNFLFANSAIEDAIKAYSNSQDFKQNIRLIQLRSECYMVMGSLSKCQEDIMRLAKLGKDRSVEFDRDMLQAIRLVFKDDTEIYFNEDSDIEQMDLIQGLTKAVQNLNQLNQLKMQGRLFKQFHLFIFRGVFNFHLKKYEDALRDFQMAKSQKELSITEKRLKCKGTQSVSDIFIEEEIPELTEDEEDADLLEILEIKFNELICLVILKQYKKAKERCKQLIENINESKQEGLQYLLKQLDALIRNEQKFIEYPRVICLYDEPKENLICFQVPILFLHDLKIRLSFSLPKLSPPSLQITFDRKLIEDIGTLSVENKPEAPWIRREQLDDMIIFTDNIQLIDDVRLETEKDDEPKQELVDKTQVKNNLMLDRDIEDKLKRILERKQKQQSK